MENSKKINISDRLIIEKAWEDEAFKQELLANPKAAIEKLAGGSLDSLKGKDVVVHDHTDTSVIYLSIPPNPEDLELTEEELEEAAGGDNGVCNTGCTAIRSVDDVL